MHISTRRVRNEPKNIVRISSSRLCAAVGAILVTEAVRAEPGEAAKRNLGQAAIAVPGAANTADSSARARGVVRGGLHAADRREPSSVLFEPSLRGRAAKIELYQTFPPRILCLPSSLLVPLE